MKSIKEILKNGIPSINKDLFPNMPLNIFIETIGSKNCEFITRSKESSILIWDYYEFHFLNETLMFINIPFYNFKNFGLNMKSISYACKDWSFQSTISLLNNFKIEWSFEREYIFEKALCLKTNGDVILIFDYEDEGKLAKISII
jgi:hypothetical protein